MNPQMMMHVQTGRGGVVSRRTFMHTAGVAAGVATLGWKELMLSAAPALRQNGMSCILLFMSGGPSQFETFDPKPGTESGGPTQAIETAVKGIRVAEHWPHVAKAMNDIALIRSLTNKEGAHLRAVYQLHTGYLPVGGVKYPTFGSIAARELGDRESDLPNFVSIGNRTAGIGPGFLGMQFAPLVVGDPNRMPNNSELPQGVNGQRFQNRLSLLKDLESEFAQSGGAQRVQDHQAMIHGAAQLVTSPRLKAFDLTQEKDTMRDQYGRNAFGQGCLLARRLIEAGVTFVEIESFGWDTHLDNFERTKALSSPVDQGFAALLNDLKARGRLDKTLIIWMGEFGRTPRINAAKGRDHYPRAFNAALAGGGIQGGRVIGATDDKGIEIKDRPVTVADLLCTFCQALGINPRKENRGPLDRPIRIVDGGTAVKELFR